MSQVLFEYGLIHTETLQVKTRVTVKGQIMIPIALRKKYKVMKGSRIIMFDNGDSIVLRLMNSPDLKGLQGSLKSKGGLKFLVVERQEERR